MSRSRKRKAATAAAKAVGCGHSAEEDGQSQSSATTKEERYVPRFSSAKRSRTISSRASRSVSDKTTKPSTNESENQLEESNNKIEDVTLTEVEGVHSNVQLHGQYSDEETQCHTAADVCAVLNSESMASNTDNCEGDVALSEELQEDSAPQLQESIPGMSLSQNLLPHPNLLPDSDSTICDGECGHVVPQDLPSDTAPVAPLAVQTAHSATTCMMDTSREEQGVEEFKPMSCEDRMNLGLLDPLECNEEEEQELHDRGPDDTTEAQQKKTRVNGSEDTPLITANPSVITSLSVGTHTQLTGCDELNNTAAPLCPSHTDTENIPPPDSHTGHSLQAIAQPATSIPPPESDVQQPGTANTSPDIWIEKSTGEVICEYVCPENNSKEDVGAIDGSMAECGGNSECMETGMEDVMIVGGENGQIQLTSNSQYSGHTKSISPVTSPDELLAVREMMDLTAHDLLESQLLEEATVPSCSPVANTTSQKVERGRGLTPQRRDPHGSRDGGDVAQHNNSGGTRAVEGSQILHGLIEELSALNQFVLACKRELEAGRRQRAAWIRTQQCHRRR